MRLAPAVTRNEEGEGPVVGGNIMKNKEECQTQAPVTEGAGIKLNNIDNKKGGPNSATVAGRYGNGPAGQ